MTSILQSLKESAMSTIRRVPLFAAPLLIALALAAPALADDKATLEAAFARGDAFLKEGKSKEAAASFETALGLAPGVYGKDHEYTATILYKLGEIYDSMGQYAKAEPLFLRIHKIVEDKLGKDHPYVASSLNNLANLYDDIGQYEEAEPLYRRALRI